MFRIEQSADAIADRLIFLGASLVVVIVAAFAAVVSYTHIYDLASHHGQSGLAARFAPLSPDGVILAASLMMLHRSRRGAKCPYGLRAMLWGGIATTLAANAASGIGWGAIGITIAVSSGAAFVATIEALIWFIRVTRDAKQQESSLLSADPQQVAHNAIEAAALALEATARAGNPLSQRQIMARFGVPRDDERAMRERVELKLGLRKPVEEPVDDTAPATG